MSLGNPDLELVFDGGGDQVVGMRFQGVAVPQGASITNAYLQFEVDEATSVATSLTIRAEASDSAPSFSATHADISSRPTTAAAVGWSPPPWPAKNEAGPDQRSPDLAAVIQEIVDRPGWTAGNSLVLIVMGTGERVAESFDGEADAAPLLHVEYSPE